MAIGFASENLGWQHSARPVRRSLLAHLLRLEAWLDERASRRALHVMDERDLADLGLSKADVEHV